MKKYYSYSENDIVNYFENKAKYFIMQWKQKMESLILN